MQKVIITGYTAKSEGVILETNIPARLKPNRIPSKVTFVSWDKIGKLLFEDYTELEVVASRNSNRNGDEKHLKQLTAEMFLCNFLNCSREALQYNISQHPTKVIKAMEEFRALNDL